MKLNAIIPWICVLALGAGAASVYVAGTKKDAEIEQLRKDGQEMEHLRTDLAETKSSLNAQQEEINGFRKDKEELLRLRSQVGQIQSENLKLTKQLQSAQALQNQAAQDAQNKQQQLSRLSADLETSRRSTEQAQQVAQRNACMNQLARVTAAKQQWALEHGKPQDATPTPNDLSPYLGNAFPTCPANGVYTLHPVNQRPTCSTEGHALP